MKAKGREEERESRSRLRWRTGGSYIHRKRESARNKQTSWAVVVAQLAERLLPKPEVRSLNSVNNKI